MGFLKKITRPISKVLDKIVPNEIKPALPFLAAAAPFMAPGIMGIGGNTMLSRALISGGLNLGAQLAQEGSEGDFNALSLALASGIGALSAPGSAGGRTIGDSGASYSQVMGGDKLASAGTPSAGEYLRNLSDSGGITDQALNFLGKGSDKLIGLSEGLAADGIFSKAGAKALSIPLTQGTMDLGFAEARRAANDVVDDALAGIGEGASDADRALAIRNAMEAYGYFSEDEILSTIEAAGYRAGGRVGFMFGSPKDPGLTEYLMEKMKEKNKEEDDDSEEIDMTIMDFENIQGAKDGGLMNLGGKEMDLRKGGFVPIGKKERADDVPARLSKNEFVMTADAVRAAGGGSVNEGAKRMYDVMNKLEARA